MEKNKKFDAVSYMRKVREELSEKYWQHPDVLKKDMETIREKYKLKLQKPDDKLHLKAS